MAAYFCNECGNLCDDDYDGAFEDPRDELQLLCEDCIAEVEEEE